jgi:branched-chain amino acid transport system permease protein
MNFNRLRLLLPYAIALAVAFCFPLVIRTPYIFSLVIPGLLWSVSCMGWNTIARTGQFSLGQAVFMTIGAYTSALLTINLHLSVWIGLLFGGMASAIVAFLLGVIVLRLGGIYFAIVTLAFGEVIRVLAMNLTNITMGTYGLILPPPSLSIGDFSLNFSVHKVAYYYLTLIIVIISGLVFWRIDLSRMGRIFRSISSDSVLSEHLGMNLMKYRTLAFTIAGFFTGLAGALFSHYIYFIGPTLFELWDSVMILIMCYVGGISSPVLGPIIGALILSITGNYLSSLIMGAKPIVFGVIVVMIVFLQPDGIVFFFRQVTKMYSNHRLWD